MKILFADSDRDMLMVFKRLFELDGHEVTTVFDAPQVIRKAAQGHYDIAILNKGLPGEDSRQLIKLMKDNKTPTIMLLSQRVVPVMLMDACAADSYMSFPFFPEELKARADEVFKKASSSEQLNVDGLKINIGKFMSDSGVHYTNEEINILLAIQNGQSFDIRKVSAYINSLNNKFESAGMNTRIKYVINEGYRLVKNNE